jgi:hypothetical protein
MPLLYPVIVGLTLLSGCSSDAQKLRASAASPRAVAASTRAQRISARHARRANARINEWSHERAAGGARRQRADAGKHAARRPREIWVPERLRNRY